MGGFGSAILKHRWFWLVGVIGLSVFFALHLGDLSMEEDATTWYPAGDPTLEAYDAFEERFESEEFVIVAYEWQIPFSPASIEYLRSLGERLVERVPYVSDAVSLASVDDIVGTETALEIRPLIDPGSDVDLDELRHRIAINRFIAGNLISEDEHVVSVVLEIDRPEGKDYEVMSAEIIAALEAVLSEEEAATGLEFHSGGGTLTEREVERVLGRDIQLFFPLGLVLTGGLLLLFFRHFPSVVLPLITVVLSLGWTLGLKSLVGSPITPVSTTLFALITVIGVASSVHLISQYWIERRLHTSRKETLLATYRSAGRPCLFTALTTAVGFGSLAISGIPAIRHLGFFAAFGIMSAFLLAMIIVPMGMDWSSHRRPRTPQNKRLGGALAAIGRFDLAHPRLVFVATVVVIVGMGLGTLLIETEGSMVDYFRKGSGIRESIDFLDARMNGISSTEVILYGERDTFKEPARLQAMVDLGRLAEAHPRVSVAYSFADTVMLINRALHADQESFYRVPDTRSAVSQSVLLYEMSGGAPLRDYVAGDYATARVSIRTMQMTNQEREALLSDVREYAADAFADLRTEITGMDLLVSGVNDRIVLTQIRSFGLAVLAITGMMIVVFGWKAGLISILPNTLPIVFVLGLMGYAGFGLNIATAIIASIAIGIVVDDTIHFFSHFRDELAKTEDRELAMMNAITKVGKALCFTTSILAAGFAVFLFAQLGIMASYGILSGTAVITALAGDLFIGPVLLAKVPVFSKRKAKRQADPK
ncbi:MAG: MMPL family transporter [Candidatus Bipolaricaulia bacterium]